ncbi:Metapyrocatechase 2 [Fusarium oxysporum f. sp. cubense]|uniref:Metapyrocatechase 2 n=1 Tax=Fusarium oxysporum f. sp. cubense TaxID=61366 RepID=A0A559KPA9_FUSOC|nr:Metapyrocatechase 2 [Fusarium oxysporum f. sp. cubense]
MALQFRDEPWKAPNPDRVRLLRPARAVYSYTSLEVAEKFLTEFGLREVGRSEDPPSISFVGHDTQPVSFVATQSDNSQLVGYYFEAASQEDFDKAARVPGAGPVTPLSTLGGGYSIKITDPTGQPFGVVYGIEKRDYDPPPKEIRPYNFPAAGDWDEENKPRRGEYQRLKYGRVPVFKFGHCGFWTENLQEAVRFYTKHFNFVPSDIMMLEQKNIPIIAFFRLNLGKDYSDHHSFILGQSSKQGPPPGPHHASFEVQSLDHQLIGHEHLLSLGYKPFWGVGRHIEGSQVFDYWLDGNGFLLEHYTDGDILNEDSGTNWVPMSRDKHSNWGPDFPPGLQRE